MKVLSSIVKIESCIIISFNDEQLPKACNSILLTEEGILICTKDMHPLKEPFLIIDKDEGIEI